MIGMTADLPVFDAPVMTFSLLAANDTTRGSRFTFLGQRTRLVSWSCISDLHLEQASDLEERDLATPRAELLGGLQEVSDGLCVGRRRRARPWPHDRLLGHQREQAGPNRDAEGAQRKVPHRQHSGL